MSAYAFNLPDLGEGLQEAELVSWLVAVGDHVVQDQPLLTVETEKSLVEIPSPVTGRVTALHGAPGEALAVGALLAEFDAESRADAGAIVGELPEREQPREMAPVPAAVTAPPDGILASPAVRAEARRRGLDLAAAAGSGPEGSITMADLAAVQSGGGDSEILGGLRRTMARNMSMARHSVAVATVTGNADISAWEIGEAPLVRLALAVIAACRAEPALNAWYDEQDHSRTLHARVDLGVATDTADGLLVPTLRGAHALSVVELGRGLEQLEQACSQRALSPEQLSGQTITISNFGSIAGEYAQMVVVPPQVAIVGAGRITRVPVAVGDAIAVHPRLPLSLSFDHRVVTGGEAARFLKALIFHLEDGRKTQEN